MKNAMLRKGFILILFSISLLISSVYAQKKKIASFFFDTNIRVLDAQQKKAFSQFLSELDSVDIVSISIIGYCDDRGGKGYNDVLSVNRANHIKELLEQHEINTEKVKVLTGNGKIDLIEPSNVNKQRINNRRVDLVIGYVKKNLRIDNSILPNTLKVGDKIILENVLFENSKSILLKESIPVLEKITNIIKEKKQYDIAILGHICCNPPGKDVKDFVTGELNLSQARAKAVYDYLIKNGVDEHRLAYKGMMGNFPLGKGEKNDRRVELQITGINN
ncbi:OmpA family protein [Pedobacter xixiisoli]|uniref:OmpA family protein n=1 Tax=Pedobacter xixiisoli TaxID=1476464 RepID=A0A286ADA8_9SPHI|nr:OmpA family protein [Pedobacter xixiisoli]SOD19827.1 OmpA family protein [Pedobacter xixiisoli]